MLTVGLTWKAAQDSYNQIESAEALNVALITCDDIRNRCVLIDETLILNKEAVKELKKLKDEEGLICTDDGQRVFWNGTKFIDINCCCEHHHHHTIV
jgi:thymidine kinase